MTSKFYTLFLSIFFYVPVLLAQSISSTVVDGTTNEPLSFVTVQLGENYGVITNSEGVFEINTKRYTPTDSLIFSYLGYEQKAIALKDFSGAPIILKEAVNSLGQVYILDKNLDVLKVMDSVRAHLTRNYQHKPSKLLLFERNKTTNQPIETNFEIKKAEFIDKKILQTYNSDLEQLSQRSNSFVSSTYRDTFMEHYADGNDNSKLEIKKSTKLFNSNKSSSTEELQKKAMQVIIEKLSKSNTFKVRSGIIPIEDSLDFKTLSANRADTLKVSDKKSTLNKIFEKYSFGEKSDFDFIHNPKDYTYEITGAIDYANEMVYIIKFAPDRRSAQYSGEMFVSADSYAVLKLDYGLAEGKTGPSINLKLLLGIKFKETGSSALVLYQKNPTGTYYPKYIKNTTTQYAYFDRSLSFIENAPRADRIKLKLGILNESILKSENQLLVLDTEMIAPAVFDSMQEEKDHLIQNIDKYDPALWQEYTIIAPDEAIKSFDY